LPLKVCLKEHASPVTEGDILKLRETVGKLSILSVYGNIYVVPGRSWKYSKKLRDRHNPQRST